MKVVSGFLPSTSVSSSAKCRFTANAEHLVVARTNTLLLYALKPQGLVLESETTIWGRILHLLALPKGDGTHNLLCLTDHPDPRLIVLRTASSSPSSDSPTKLVQCGTALSLHERAGRSAEFCTDVRVDESGTVGAVSVYAGRLRVVKFERGQVEEGQDFDISIPEYTLIAFSFLPVPVSTPSEPILALIHRDHLQRTQLLARAIDLEQREIDPVPSTALPATLLSDRDFPFLSEYENHPTLLPLAPASDADDDDENETWKGGMLILGGRKICAFQLAGTRWQARRRAKLEKTEKDKKKGGAKGEAAKEKNKKREEVKRKPRAAIDWPWGEVSAWTQLDEQRFILGDVFGRLAMLVFNPEQEWMLTLLPLGEASPPTTLTHLNAQHLFLGSHMGDSQLLRLLAEPDAPLQQPTLPIPSTISTILPSSLSDKGKDKAPSSPTLFTPKAKGKILDMKGSFIDIAERFDNIAPVQDAVLVESSVGGQTQLITCSGGQNTGALKVVRKGAAFDPVAAVDGVENVLGVWSLKQRFKDEEHTHLLVSTLRGTHLLELSPNSVASLVDISHKSFSSSPTLGAANMLHRKDAVYSDSSFVTQVTAEGVAVLEYDFAQAMFRLQWEWKPGMLAPSEDLDAAELARHENIAKTLADEKAKIVHASFSPSQIALALSPKWFLLLNMDERGSPIMQRFRKTEYDISAISCTPTDGDKSNYSAYFALGYWEAHIVEVLRTSSDGSFVTICRTSSLPALPRSVRLFNFGQKRAHLLAGLSDGQVISWEFCKDASKEERLRDKKVSTLGATPVEFVSFVHKDRQAICAVGARATIFFGESGRLVSAPVLVNDVVNAAPLNAEGFENCIVFARPAGLSIGRLNNLDKTHIRTIDFGLDNPRIITHLQQWQSLAVGCVQVTPTRVGDVSTESKSLVKLVDDTSFDVQDQFALPDGFDVTAIQGIRATVDGKELTVLCVGAVSHKEQEMLDGVCLILTVTNQIAYGKRLSQLVSADIKGVIYAFAEIEGYIAVAKDTSVVLLKLTTSFDNEHILEKVTEWNHNYFVTSLHAIPGTLELIVGDAISSVTILRKNGNKLETVARDYSPLWPVAVGAMDSNIVLGANVDCNLFSFKINRPGILENDGMFYLNEQVNGFINGSVVTVATEGPIQPKQLFYTSTGGIGVLSVIKESEDALNLTALQQNMAEVMEGIGGVNHSTYRSPANPRGRSDGQQESRGFLDGDFLESYLSLASDATELKSIREGSNEAQRLNMTDADIRKILERLQSTR